MNSSDGLLIGAASERWASRRDRGFAGSQGRSRKYDDNLSLTEGSRGSISQGRGGEEWVGSML